MGAGGEGGSPESASSTLYSGQCWDGNSPSTSCADVLLFFSGVVGGREVGGATEGGAGARGAGGGASQ